MGITTKPNNQLLIRPFAIYEIPKEKNLKSIFVNDNQSDFIFKIINKTNYLYKTNLKMKRLNLKVLENLALNQYIPAHLKYTNLQSCLLFELTQFLDAYTILGYLEEVTVNALEIVKFKSKRSNKKQVFLISNNDCVIVKKDQEKNKTVNELIVDDIKVNQTGKVLIDNGKFLTIQKGHPYFFPNCKTDNFKENGNLQYKLLTLNKSIPNHKSNPFLNYYDITKRLKPYGFTHVKFSKMFIRKDGKFYTSPIPLFLNNFSLTKENLKENQLKTLRVRNTKLKTKKLKIKQCLPLLLESSDLISNKIKGNTSFNNNLTGLKFLKYPFKKSIGIHSLTEDYFEQEVNSVYCKNGEFIEKGEVIGLLNFEKEITGDIVQGLPRIEELLEARKKKPTNKYLAKKKKKKKKKKK